MITYPHKVLILKKISNRIIISDTFCIKFRRRKGNLEKYLFFFIFKIGEFKTILINFNPLRTNKTPVPQKLKTILSN